MENLETIEDFIAQYFKMRDAQKKYFQLRYTSDLNTAKRLEKELDNECMNYIKRKALAESNKQTELFG